MTREKATLIGLKHKSRDLGKRKNNPCFLMILSLYIDIQGIQTKELSYFKSWNLSEENKNTKLKRYLHSHIHGGIIYNRAWKQPKCLLLDEWVKKCG